MVFLNQKGTFKVPFFRYNKIKHNIKINNDIKHPQPFIQPYLVINHPNNIPVKKFFILLAFIY